MATQTTTTPRGTTDSRPRSGIKGLRPLEGTRVLSLALNLPGPAALMRCRSMGATCIKLEPPAPQGAPTGSSGDPMGLYNPVAYAQLHQGVKVLQADLKSAQGQATLKRELAKADVLLTSFRPSALAKLGLGWRPLHRLYPYLSQVAIVGKTGADAEIPGHDLTYLAEHGLLQGLQLPATLYADMAGALLASETVLQVVLHQRKPYTGSGDPPPSGKLIQVALGDAAAWAALPRQWGLTLPGGAVGGAHAGYRIYPCRGGRVAVAALEPHFALSLCAAAGLPYAGLRSMFSASTHHAFEVFFARQTIEELQILAAQKDLPLHPLGA